jgi:sec-independent protein translocase protein TatB
MFDLTSSKLLILGAVALIVVGPKELPFLLRTIGKYVAMIRRQANEFRAQFDEAMREAELEDIKKDLESVARDTETSLRDVQSTVESDLHAAEQSINASLEQTTEAAVPAPAPVTPDVQLAITEPAHTFDPLNGLDPGHTVAHPPTNDAIPAPTHASVAEPAPALAKTGT